MELREYQKRGVERAIAQERCYFAVDMSLGKTAIMLKVCEKLGKPALVIAPPRVARHTWAEEAAKWWPSAKVNILSGPRKALDAAADIHVISYDSLSYLAGQISAVNKQFYGGILILDEATYIKSHSSKRFKIIKELFKLFRYRYNLSGTLYSGELSALWPQFYVIDEGKALGPNISAFRRDYMRPHPRVEYVYVEQEGAREKVIEKIKPLCFRLAATDYLELPDYIYNRIYCDMSDAGNDVAAVYEHIEKDFVAVVNDETISAPAKATASMKLRQIIQGAIYDEQKNVHVLHDEKRKALVEYLETVQEPVIICYQFAFELDMLREMAAKIPGAVVFSDLSEKARGEALKRWNAGKVPALICHPQSISHGLNLQYGGHRIVWLGLTWSLEVFQQLNGRLRRPGQTEKVYIDCILMRGTIDERIYDTLSARNATQKDMLDAINAYCRA
jgi:SNF2 family DNA or RNA helicase